MNYFQQYERERKFKPGVIWVTKENCQVPITKFKIIYKWPMINNWTWIKPLEVTDDIHKWLIGIPKAIRKIELEHYYVQSTN